MTKLQFGFQEVGGEPLDGIGTDGAGAYRLGGRPGDGGTGGEHGLVVGQDLGVANLGVDHRHAGAAMPQYLHDRVEPGSRFGQLGAHGVPEPVCGNRWCTRGIH
jgi:hypothetical protein